MKLASTILQHKNDLKLVHFVSLRSKTSAIPVEILLTNPELIITMTPELM